MKLIDWNQQTVTTSDASGYTTGPATSMLGSRGDTLIDSGSPRSACCGKLNVLFFFRRWAAVWNYLLHIVFFSLAISNFDSYAYYYCLDCSYVMVFILFTCSISTWDDDGLQDTSSLQALSFSLWLSRLSVGRFVSIYFKFSWCWFIAPTVTVQRMCISSFVFRSSLQCIYPIAFPLLPLWSLPSRSLLVRDRLGFRILLFIEIFFCTCSCTVSFELYFWISIRFI